MFYVPYVTGLAVSNFLGAEVGKAHLLPGQVGLLPPACCWEEEVGRGGASLHLFNSAAFSAMSEPVAGAGEV